MQHTCKVKSAEPDLYAQLKEPLAACMVGGATAKMSPAAKDLIVFLAADCDSSAFCNVNGQCSTKLGLVEWGNECTSPGGYTTCLDALKPVVEHLWHGTCLLGLAGVRCPFLRVCKISFVALFDTSWGCR